MKIFQSALLLISLSVCNVLSAQQSLGMEIVGDDHSEFGLMISQWLDTKAGLALAPGLIDEELENLDRQHLQQLRAARQAFLVPVKKQ